jgi:two-component system, cell cycle response regulator
MISDVTVKTGQGEARKTGQSLGRLDKLLYNVCDIAGMRRSLKELSFITDFQRAVTASLVSDEVITAAACKLYEYFHFSLLVLNLSTATGDRLVGFAPLDVAAPASAGLKAVLGSFSGLKAKDVKGFRSLGLKIPQESPRFDSVRALELPEGLGKVHIYSEFNLVSHFSEELLIGMLDSFGTALRNALEYERTRELSLRDGLTGLFNRRVMEEMLEIEECKRQVTPLSLLIIDLDNFKMVNDTYGHPVGDLVLKETARVLRESTRGSDIVVRSGGEEFSAMLPSVTPLRALEIGERIRVNLARTVVNHDGRQLRITASIGVAHRSPKDICSMKDLVQRADQALYRAKHEGKNRVCVYPVDTVVAAGAESGRVKEKAAKVVRIK